MTTEASTENIGAAPLAEDAERPALRVRGLTKHHNMVFRSGSRLGAFLYGNLQDRRNVRRFLALDDVSFDLRPGRMMVLVGDNGAGKSTLLQTVAGITNPDAGAVEVNGRLSALLELGFGFHPDLNGYENCYLQGAILGMPRSEIEQRLPEIMRFAGIGEAMDRPVRHYSNGMFARLAFSLSAHVDPDLLLIDEILAVGDPGFQERCIQHIQRMRENGVAVLLVTHSLAMVSIMADDALWLEKGRVVRQGPAREVIREYKRTVNERRFDRGEEHESEFNATHLHSNPLKTRRRELVNRVRSSFEGEIKAVRLLDGEGRPYDKRAPFGDLTVEANYDVPQPVEGMFLKCQLINQDGWVVSQSCSPPVEEIDGWPRTGQVRLRFEKLALSDGPYAIVVGFFHPGDESKDIRLCEAQAALEIVPGYVPQDGIFCFLRSKTAQRSVIDEK
ncbi:ATP-binding cassette domain-containing protein [Candidatus Sumerlaeota bacterium]|nr:ATP-binding cassette domain-containing protein [Candidatus Sumerlaeota bacterium]